MSGLGFLAWLAAAPLVQGVAPNGESFALLQGAARTQRIDVSVPSGRCTLAAQQLAARLDRSFEFNLESEKHAPGSIRLVVGTASDPRWVELASACGVSAGPEGFRVLEQDFEQPGDAFLAVFEDPLAHERPMVLLFGNDPGRLAAYLDWIPRLSSPHLWVYAAGDLALECALSVAGRPITASAIDYRARRARYFANGKTVEFEGATLHVRNPIEPERWKKYAVALEGARRRTVAWLKLEEPPRAEFFVYEHLEDMEECLGESQLAVLNRLQPLAHLLIAPGMPDDGGASFARLLARATLGPPAQEWLMDGLAVGASERWWRWPLDEWIAHLSRGRVLPTLTELLRPGAQELTSLHSLLPARGILFRQVAKGSDPGRLKALWKGAPFDMKSGSTLYQTGVRMAQKDAKDQGLRRGTSEGGKTVRGLALLESARVRYGSSEIDEALAAARALSHAPNAVSLTVQATLQEPAPPFLSRARYSAYGSASDLALANSALAAHRASLGVLLALEVLAQPNGSWADVLAWAFPEDRWQFWERYQRVALHYALLAEVLGVEFFSFGSNLREMTRTTPGGEGFEVELDDEQVEQRRNGWQNVITRLRGAFRGGLTYAARFPAEAQDIAFFDQLDYVGLQLYPRVPPAVGIPDDKALRGTLRFELERALELAVRWNKPLLIVQLGFPARADSWSTPMVPRGELDLEAQRRYLGALAEVLGGPLENGSSLRGLFLWNWPLDPQACGPAERGFALRGKPVEEALGRLFER